MWLTYTCKIHFLASIIIGCIINNSLCYCKDYTQYFSVYQESTSAVTKGLTLETQPCHKLHHVLPTSPLNVLSALDSSWSVCWTYVSWQRNSSTQLANPGDFHLQLSFILQWSLIRCFHFHVSSLSFVSCGGRWGASSTWQFIAY